MQPLATSTQAVEYWADLSTRVDTALRGLDRLLPGTDDNRPITGETVDDVRSALEEARLACDTVLGAYTRRVHQEQGHSNGQVAHYQQTRY